MVWQARYKVWGNAVQEEWIARAPQRPIPVWGEVQEAAPSSVHVPRPQNLRGNKRTYEYDVCGQGTLVRDGQIETRYERDAIGRLTAKQAKHERCEYLYDKASRIASAELYTLAARGSSLKNRVSLKYGARGEVIEEYTPTGWRAHTYDELGNRVSTTISGERTIDWLHYGSGHVHQIRVDGAAIADIERDDLHREVLRTQGKLTSHFGYDAVGRRARQAAQRGRAADDLLAKPGCTTTRSGSTIRTLGGSSIRIQSG